MQVTAYGRQTIPERGVVRSCDPLQNFGGSNHIVAVRMSLFVCDRHRHVEVGMLSRTNCYNITGAAEPKVVKICTRVGYINSNNRMPYHQQKGRGYVHVTVLKFCRLL